MVPKEYSWHGFPCIFSGSGLSGDLLFYIYLWFCVKCSRESMKDGSTGFHSLEQRPPETLRQSSEKPRTHVATSLDLLRGRKHQESPSKY